MILIDYSQAAIAAVTSVSRELAHKEPEEQKSLIRHVILNMVRSYKSKYGKEYGDIVICCDDRHYWRKEQFPNYKANRKKVRENSEIDWKLLFEILEEMKTTLREVFPYVVLQIDKAEADDIISVICQWSQDNQLFANGLVEEPQPILIISSDHDFKQLQQFDNVRQWSPHQKKYVNVSTSELRYKLVEHVVRGDSGDGIPNIKSDDDVFIDGRRQKPISQKFLDEFLDRGRDACETEEQRRNYDRNKTLVDLLEVPSEISDKIVEEFVSQEPKRDSNKMMNYMVKNRMKLLLQDIQDF